MLPLTLLIAAIAPSVASANVQTCAVGFTQSGSACSLTVDFDPGHLGPTSFALPAGIDLFIQAVGGNGGSDDTSQLFQCGGGVGGYIGGHLETTVTDSLTVDPGQAGVTPEDTSGGAGGYGGGGAGGDGGPPASSSQGAGLGGGGGGGATTVWDSRNGLLIVAGGGGGGGGNALSGGEGGGDYVNNTSLTDSPLEGCGDTGFGLPGSGATGGGSGGGGATAGSGIADAAGDFGPGGHGGDATDDSDAGGGGGGGGYYGGGGGAGGSDPNTAPAAGGGGGSGYVNPVLTNLNSWAPEAFDDGWVELEYTLPTTTVVSVDSNGPVFEPMSGTSQASFTITLPSAQSSTTTVDYKTVDGTGPTAATTADNEYTPVTSGSVTIPAGQTTTQVPVTIDPGDGSANAASLNFQLQLTSVSGGDGSLVVQAPDSDTTQSITIPQITGTIVDKNGKPLAGVAVGLSGTAASGPAVTRSTQTDASGRYAVYADPGSYALTVTPPSGGPATLYPSQCPSGSPITDGCNLTLSAGASDTINFSPNPVSITQITFKQLNVATDEVETVPSGGTYDGNQVDVIASLQNNTDVAQQTDVNFGDPVDDSASTAVTKSVTVPASGSLDVDQVLDTNGLAWNNNGIPHLRRTITISLSDGSSDTSTLIVNPKPVILVHGLWSDASTWSAYLGPSGFLQQSDPNWYGYAVGDGQAPGVMDTSPFTPNANTIAQNAAQENTYIQGIRDKTDAQHVDVVAHSMGGLISRFYIQEFMPNPLPGDARPVVSHLVMLGTPNEGSPCAWAALVALMVGRQAVHQSVSAGNPNINQPLRELAPDYLNIFDQQITNMRGVPFSVLAGDALSASCTGVGPTDGVVAVPSAVWILHDWKVEPLNHLQMTGSTLAFTSWVEPHLALGPTAAGGGDYTGPMSSQQASIRHISARSAATRRAAATRAAIARKPRRSAKPAKVCLQRTPIPDINTAADATVSDGHSLSLPITVPRHAGSITVTVLAYPNVTTGLLDPHGKVSEQVAAGSSAAYGLFRTLEVHAPAPGVWHLTSSIAAGTAASTVLASVALGTQPLSVALSVKSLAVKHPHHDAATQLEVRARLKRNGRPLRGARETVSLLISTQRQLVLQLSAVRRSPGTYAATTAPLTGATPATVVARTIAGGAEAVSTYELGQSCS